MSGSPGGVASGRREPAGGAEAYMAVRVSCPFCNSAFTLAEVPATGRVACPRCGDSFTALGRVEELPPEGESHGAGTGAEPAGAHPSGRPPTRWTWLAVAVVGVVLVGTGLYFLPPWRTAGKLDPDPPPSAAVVAPAELRGLGYLPPGCNLVAAVQLGPVLAHAEQTKREPRDLLTGAGVPAAVLVTLDRIGLPLTHIDHVAAGAYVPDADDTVPPRLAVALVLRHPLADEPKFLEQLKAHRVVHAGRTRYDVDVGGVPFRLAKAADTVWLFGWSEADLDATGGTTTLSPGLREMFAERLPADAAAWAVADRAKWADKPLVQLFAPKKEWLPVLKQGQAAAVGLTLGDTLRVRVGVRCADAATAETLRGYFGSKAGEGVQTGGDGEWATVDAPIGPGGAAATLRGFLDDAGK